MGAVVEHRAPIDDIPSHPEARPDAHVTDDLHRRLVTHLPRAAVVVVDASMDILLVGGEGLETLGLRGSDAVGRPLHDAMGPVAFARVRDVYEAALAGDRCVRDQRSADDSVFLRLIGTPLSVDEGGTPAALVTAFDISDLQRRENALRIHSRRLADLVGRDKLTGLPNRELLQGRLELALVRSGREGQRVALLFVDLDRFKNVNDTLGHEAGDAVLRLVAERLSSAVRAEDTVARIGGDEFVVLVDGLQRNDDIHAAVERVQQAMGAMFPVADTEIAVTASIGVALAPHDGTTVDGLLAASDRAMYQAKSGGGNRYRLFKSSMHQRDIERLHLETAMRYAIERDEFVLHYQPAVELATGRVISVEALIRWNHPERGWLLPGEFIPIAEETGFAAEITRWVLHNACRQARAWQAAGIVPIRVAVNSCSRQLTGGLGAMIKAALTASALDGEQLEIEITERYLGEDDVVRDETLDEIKRLGARIALDDFGIGYSSLARLQAFPVDVIKIDRSFIADLDRTTAIAKSIIALATNMGVRLIAEGVEHESQRAWLEAAGCEAASGFLICPPLPADRITTWLLEHAQA